MGSSWYFGTALCVCICLCTVFLVGTTPEFDSWHLFLHPEFHVGSGVVHMLLQVLETAM